jgi:PAS domain S-box-containing protein
MENTFGINIIPNNDDARVKALRRYQILDSPPEHAFDNVARLATQIFKVPISLVSLVDEKEVYFKANIGMGNARSTSRGVSLCSLAVLKQEVTVFENAPEEPCLLTNPNVAGSFGLKFYAGAPITTPDGFRIGTLCVIDKTPRLFDQDSREILESLAKIVMDEIDLRLAAIEELAKQQQLNEETAAANEELHAINDELVASQQHIDVLNEELAANNELKNMAIEQAQLGLWYINAGTGEFIPSARLKSFFGYMADEVLSYETALGHIREDYREKVAEMVETAIQNESEYDIEYPIIPNGDPLLRWVKATGKLNPASANQKAYFSGTIMDITERKLDDQRKNDFISMVSHELKTQLTSMSGYIQMLKSKAITSEDHFAAGVLDKAYRQSKKMTAIINGFLDMKRVETGKIPIEKSVFDMAELVKEAEEEAIATISSHEVIFAPVERTIVSADREKIGQVVANLISNAAKYSPNGSTINVACIMIGDMVEVSVKDQGMGISLANQQHLFDRFYRVESQDMGNINGFGIGLYICDEIIRRHEGKIWVESELGKGSTFYFTIPL